MEEIHIFLQRIGEEIISCNYHQVIRNLHFVNHKGNIPDCAALIGIICCAVIQNGNGYVAFRRFCPVRKLLCEFIIGNHINRIQLFYGIHLLYNMINDWFFANGEQSLRRMQCQRI